MPTARVLSTIPAYNREFDDYCRKLKTLSERATVYLLHDPEIKTIYRENISRTIAYLREEFYRKMNSGEDYFTYRNSRQNIFNGLIYLYQNEETDYQKGRRKDWSIYESTKKFEEQGWIFYTREGFQVLGGGVQIAGGYLTFKTGKIVRSNKLKGIGTLAIATGFSDIAEHSAIIQYEITKGESGGYNNNYIQNIMADISEYAGYSRNSGALTYKTVDFGVSLFLSFGALVKLKDPKRLLNTPFIPIKNRNKAMYPSLIDRWLNEKGGLFLWHAMRADFTFKVKKMSHPYFLYTSAMAANKFRLLLSEYTDN